MIELKQLVLLSTVILAVGCSGGPPSETVRRIGERGEGLQPLTPGDGTGARSVARSAILLDPEVREQASLTGASVDQIAVERAALFPSLSLGLVGGAGKAGAGDPDLELSGKQTMLDFGGTKRAIAAADIELQIQYLKFHSKVDASITTSLLTYRKIATLEELVSVKATKLVAIQDLQKLIVERINIGASASPDLLETRNRVERAKFELLDVKLELSEEQDKLLRLAGHSQGGAIPNFPQSCAPPEGATDGLKIARLQVVKARLALEEAERARLPRISLNPLSRLSVGGAGVSTGMNVSVNAPLLEGGAIKARQNAARNRQQSTEALVETEERSILLDDLRLKRQLASLKEKQAMLQRQIKLLSETRELYRSQYIDLGTRPITDLLDMEESLYGRQVELVEVKYDFQKNLVECASRSKILRRDLGLTGFQIYGYPLTTDGF